LAKTVQGASGTTLFNFTKGVFPMVSRILLKYFMVQNLWCKSKTSLEPEGIRNHFFRKYFQD
jgi:hypothetical protein